MRKVGIAKVTRGEIRPKIRAANTFKSFLMVLEKLWHVKPSPHRNKFKLHLARPEKKLFCGGPRNQ
jgi:hypothetical protein